MSQLCFATFARALQKVLIQPAASYSTPTRQGDKKPSTARPKMTSTDGYIVEILLRWVQDFAPVADKDGWDVWRSPKTVNGLLSQKIELHTGFGLVLNQPGLRGAAREAFGKITQDIAPMREVDFKTELIELIKDDPDISADAAEDLLYTADNDDVSFYADTFLSAISRPNKKRAGNDSLAAADVVLAARNGDLCPVCRKERLVKTVKGERRPFFEIISFTIDDDPDETDQEAVCAKCAKLVSTNDTLLGVPDVVNKLRDIRNRRIAATALQDTALDSQLHPAIISVIETLGERIVTRAIPELTLDAVRVAEKVRPEYFELAGRIRIHVLQWYRIIELDFRALEGSRGHSRFDAIAGQIADFYDQAAQHTDDQQAIFDQVADWIHTNSGSTNLSASIIVACFFVQNCEVFDAIA
ncbi:Zn-ribbon containing protein [Corynebacterium renale]|uniref:ABC-three component system protein n=1 Tax=Corynebacterium renale TaxID=1724 RepID=UPI000DA3BDB0|nr:ABC-three component system protein [Corynebacterium renale]SQG63700.1 Zn-ribbon containing protein [Corynebacterium renale]STD01664.1 Zn-ribbon containing protein [Corynebacterium renale]